MSDPKMLCENGVCRISNARALEVAACDGDKVEVKELEDQPEACPVKTIELLQKRPVSDPTKKKIRVDILSDNTCPWCWVGKRKMEKAMKAFPSVTFEVDWHPFFLSSPHGEPEPVPVLEMLCRKYGPSFIRMNNALKANGELIGIKFNDERTDLNTLQSHRLVEYSKRFGFSKQNELIEAIFEAYFSEAKDISKIDVLVNIAKKIGLDEEGVRTFLAGSEFAEEVIEYANMKRRKFRVSGVPLFLISREGQSHAIKLCGAQDPATFVAAFGQLLEEKVSL